MTHLSGSPTTRIGAAINRENQSSRNRSVMQGLEAREVEIMTVPQTGSTTTFDELQKMYSSRLFKTILRITKNWEDAEDALQDTFLRGYVAVHGLEGRSSVYSWLTRIAINSALMVLRRRRSRPEGTDRNSACRGVLGERSCRHLEHLGGSGKGQALSGPHSPPRTGLRPLRKKEMCAPWGC